MGLELKTTARVGRRRITGKLHLNSKTLDFRGRDFRWSMPIGDRADVKSDSGRLVVHDGEQKIVFEIGTDSEKWVQKIIHPPNRMTKLGVKSGHKVWVSRGFDQTFLGELKGQGAARVRKAENCELAFLRVIQREDLLELSELLKVLDVGVNIWVIWKKGSQEVGQTEVMAQAKKLGMGPSKTAAFDDQLSSMRFALKKSNSTR